MKEHAILRAAKALFVSCSGLSVECWPDLPQKQKDRWVEDASRCIVAYEKES